MCAFRARLGFILPIRSFLHLACSFLVSLSVHDYKFDRHGSVLNKFYMQTIETNHLSNFVYIKYYFKKIIKKSKDGFKSHKKM